MGDDHDDQHRPGSIDAHLWLRPSNALVIAKQMATDLSAADPQNSARYQANFEAFSARLGEQDRRLKNRLAPLAAKPFFVFHQTFDYFEAAYGLNHTGVLAIGGDVRPGARHIAEMRAKLEAAGPSCLFSEPPVRPKLSDTLTSGLPVRFAELDALGYGVTVRAGGYGELITRIGDELAKCLESLDKGGVLGIAPKPAEIEPSLALYNAQSWECPCPALSFFTCGSSLQAPSTKHQAG